MWDSIRDGVVTMAEQYGVNPLVFLVIYFGTIPLYLAAIGWVVRRLLRGRSYLVPGLMAALFYLSSYLYVFAVGRNLPYWVYGGMIAFLAGSSYFTIRNIRERTGMNPKDCTHDLIVLGGGAAGLTAARLGARFGAKTLLVEQGHFGEVAEEGTPQLGGDCTWEGCVPSKTLLRAARAVHEQRHASRYGLTDITPDVDFAAVMEHVRDVRQRVFERDAHPRRLEALGADVRAGRARFLDPHTVEIEQSDGVHTASARYIIVAAGAGPESPAIDGLDRTPHLTTASVFEISRLPERLLILGAGPVGTELAQAFQRLGAQVTVVEERGRILAGEDADAAAHLRTLLEEEGVRYHLGATVKRVGEGRGEGSSSEDEDGSASATAAVFAEVQTAEGEAKRVEADALLVATGRRAALDALHLDAADVEHTEDGITTSGRGRTSQRHIYAAGDVAGRHQLTHMSEHDAKVATVNALLKIPIKRDDDHVPRVIYTDPELARVGATQAHLHAEGKVEGEDYAVYRFDYDRLDRATCEGTPDGFVEVYATRWRGEILGVTVLGARAGELISEYTVAMKNGVTARNLADTVHPYPTYGLAARRAADGWYARRQTEKIIGFITNLFGYEGTVPDADADPRARP